MRLLVALMLTLSGEFAYATELDAECFDNCLLDSFSVTEHIDKQCSQRCQRPTEKELLERILLLEKDNYLWSDHE
jgi:hypothetical protein